MFFIIFNLIINFGDIFLIFNQMNIKPILKITYFIIILLISKFAYPQTYTEKLLWQRPLSLDDGFKVLNFLNSEYDLNNLPYYSKTIKFNESYKNKSFSIKLEKKSFIALTDDEEKLVSNKKIAETINLESNLYFARGVPVLQIKISPFKKNIVTGKIEKLESFSYSLVSENNPIKKVLKSYTSSSVLRQGKWFKIPFNKTGVYMLTFDELKSIGIENPENVRIFGNASGMLPLDNSGIIRDDLVENNILIQNSSVIFYVQGPDKWDFDESNQKFVPVNHLYSKKSYYFFTSDYNSGYDNSIKTYSQPAATETNNVSEFNDYALHENDFVNLSRSGRNWFGETFDVNLTQSFNFSFPDIVTNIAAKADLRLAAYSGVNTSFSIGLNNVNISLPVFAVGSYDNAQVALLNADFNTGTSSDIPVNITFNRVSPSYTAWLDYIYINVKRKLIFRDVSLKFRNFETLGAGNITKYNVSNMQSSNVIWDITDPTRAVKLNFTLNGSIASFKSESELLRKYIVFNSNTYLKPDLSNVTDVENQNLHSYSGNYELLIVTHPDFLESAKELELLHEQQDNMKVITVTTEQVYNEFSSGARDISAIRNFASMIYNRANSGDTLKYLLLFGDGSYDNKNDTVDNTNFIPTYQSFNSISDISTYSTDDYYGLLDIDEGEINYSLTGLMDIGVGRIIADNVTDAQNMVKKIINYKSSETFGDWRNQLCFIADDENYMVHMSDADTLTRYIEAVYPSFNIQKIYLDAYPQQTISGGERYPDVNDAFNYRIQKGAVLINYTGHGGEYGLAHERILTNSEIEAWKNFDKLPVFVTATCEFTRFDDFELLTAGERIFLNPEGGGIAMFTTARLAWISANATLTKSFYRHVFKELNGEKPRLGDISRLTKNELTGTNKMIFFLIGDPALEIGCPGSDRVITKTINQHDISVIDTLKALSKVTFTGEIQDKNGNKLTNYNGYVYPNVYDKSRIINTLNNDGEGVFTFNSRDNVIFRGKSSIVNGDFSFSFIVPRDIMLNVDTGKVSYYADNAKTDASGYSFDFMVGDISDSYTEDTEGPGIKLYMNDESFVSGGITDANPSIFSLLSDESGINISSGGIGHDITAVIDSDDKNVIVLNDDYRADADTYKSGSLEHFLFELPAGEHNLKLKVWDVYNNSSEEYIDFVVVEADKLNIAHLLNYPNPFTTHTDFYFEHNMPGTDIEIIIQIFTVSGKLVKTIDQTYFSDGYRAGPFSWNGTDDFGNRIGRGVYVYRLKVRSLTGEVVEKYEKLLILK